MNPREKLEENQLSIYIVTIILSVFVGLYWSESSILTWMVEPIIALLLYSMFCQIPFLALKQAFRDRSFFKALLFGNFVLIPILVWGLISVFPTAPIITLGILLVLLTPCIDYVIVFTHLGKGNSRAILAATPVLFVCQMLLLPLYLWLMIGKETLQIMEFEPFIRAFLLMIILPFLLAVMTQVAAKSTYQLGKTILDASSWMPVPLMALTLFFVVTSQIGLIQKHPDLLLKVIPLYILYAILAPFIGRFSARLFAVDVFNSRAVAFSISTRNSLVVLPLAFALPVPEGQLLAAVIVTQTIVEIVFELIYIKIIPLLIRSD